MMKRLVMALVVLSALIVAEEPNLLTLGNDSVQIRVTNTPAEQGRFAIETTGGDPSRDNDDKQPLIYGRPIPWTSYTTVRIDGQNYVFGGATKKRAGKTGRYAVVHEQSVTNNAIVTRTTLDGIEVTQRLSLFRNPLSRVMDTVLIEYRLRNVSERSKTLGLRMMLDTLLGQNDGAPFRLKEHAYQSEQEFVGKGIAPYWQVFDSLKNPAVIAQGVVSDSESGIVAPDRVLLSNWGLLADNPWTFPYQEGRSFVREGELELDTALAMFWNEQVLAPGESRTVQTLYGLGGVSLAPGELSLGLAMVSELDVLSREPQLLVAYVMNNGGYDSNDTRLYVELPEGLDIVEGTKALTLGPLLVGESRQLAIMVQATEALKTGTYPIVVKAESSNLEANRLERSLKVLGPPSMALAVTTPASVSAGPLTYSQVKARVKNRSNRYVSGVQLSVDPKSALRIPDFEIVTKSVDRLAPGEVRELDWTVEILDTGQLQRDFSVHMSGPSILPKDKLHRFQIEPLVSSLTIMPSRDIIQQGEVFFIDVMAFVPAAFKTGVLELKYSSDKVRLVRQSLHPAFEGARTLFQHEQGRSRIENLDYQAGAYSGSLFKLHFVSTQSGVATFELYNDGKPISMKLVSINKGD